MAVMRRHFSVEAARGVLGPLMGRVGVSNA
jgi:hypothetical protein